MNIKYILTAIITITLYASFTHAQDSTFTFKQQAYSVNEGSSLRVTIVAPNNLSKTTRIPVRAQAGTARTGTDFTTLPTTFITFYKGGLKEKSVTIRTRADSAVESPETFTVRATGVSGTATVTINDMKPGGGSTTPTPPTPISTSPGYTCNSDELERINGFKVTLKNNSVYGESTLGITAPDAPMVYEKFGKWYATGFSFPGYPGSTRLEHLVNTNEYMSIKFTVPTSTPIGNAIEWNIGAFQPGIGSSGDRLAFSVSECRGDFRKKILNKELFSNPEINNLSGNGREIRCAGIASGGGTNLRIRTYSKWPTTLAELTPAQSCPVVPGRTYYLNISPGPIILTTNGLNPDGSITQNDQVPPSSLDAQDRYFSHPDHENTSRNGGASPYINGRNSVRADINIYSIGGVSTPGSNGWFTEAQTCMNRNGGQIGRCLDAYPKRTIEGQPLNGQ